MNSITDLLDLEDVNISISSIDIEGQTKTIYLESTLEAHFWPYCGFRMHSRGTKNRKINQHLEFGIIQTRGLQYTSEQYCKTLNKYGIIQSMNSDGGRCHDNARCESMWARMKTELLYDRYDIEKMNINELKVLISVTSSAIGIIVESVHQMEGFLLLLRDRDTMIPWL